MARHLTRHPLTVTDTHGFHIFRTYRVPLPWLIAAGFGGLFVGGFALFFAGALLLAGVQTLHPDWGMALVFDDLFTLPIGALGLYLISRYLVLCGFRVTLDNTGLILWTYRGRTAVTWDDITALYVGAYPRPHPLVRSALLLFCPVLYLLDRLEARGRYTLCLRDGRYLRIPSALPSKAALAGVIGSAITQARLPAVLALYREGAGCEFGPVRVAADGLHARAKTCPWKTKVLPWEEFDRITCDRTTLRLWRRGKPRPWTSAPLASCPNAVLFLTLVRQIGDETRHT